MTTTPLYQSGPIVLGSDFSGIAYNLNPPNLLEMPLSQQSVASALQGGPVASGAVSGVMPATGAGTAPAGGGFQNAVGGASIGLAIGQAIGSMYSAWKSGKTSKYVLGKQAEIQEYNRQMAQMSAESAYRQGEAQIAQLTYRAGQVKAKQRTALAKAGVVLGEGSAAEVTASTDIMKKLDKSTAQLNAVQAAWGYKQQALQASAQGGIYSGLASYTQQAALGQGFSSLLDKGTLAADRWYRYFGGGSNVMGYGDY